jgi:hypothetical protein
MRTIPVLLTGYNRPDLLKKNLSILRSLEKGPPIDLYVHLDGPKNDLKDVDLVRECRSEIARQSQFPDNNLVLKDTYIQRQNLGCRAGMQFAISWFFSQNPFGLILEDDILIHPEVFRILPKLQSTYEATKTVGSISFFTKQKAKNFLSNRSCISWRLDLPNIWGWATWAKKWNYYEDKSTQLSQTQKLSLISKLGYKRVVEVERTLDRLDTVKDTWDIQWLATHMKHNWLSVTPNLSLSKNIGFDYRATHTKIVSPEYIKELPDSAKVFNHKFK